MASRRLSPFTRVFREPFALVPSHPIQKFRIKILLWLLLFLGGWAFWRWYHPTVRVEDTKIGRSNYGSKSEHWTEPRLRQLWQQESFRDLRADSQWELFLKLCDWTHRQWKNGIPKPYPPCNAIDILRMIRSGKTGGFCAQYAYVLGDVLKSYGFFNVRYVEATQANGSGHFGLEVWSDEYKKWVLLGPWRDLYYELVDSHVPANAYEVREYLHGGPEVRAVRIDGGPVTQDNREMCKYYEDFAVGLRSDLMRNPQPLTEQDRWEMFLFLKDDRNSALFKKSIPYLNVTSRFEDLYFDRNKTRVEYKVDHAHVYLGFYNDGTMPNFKCFVMRTDPTAPWQEVPEDITVDRDNGVKTLWVAGRNKFNQNGVVNRVDISW
jgi:hypothetical protein